MLPHLTASGSWRSRRLRHNPYVGAPVLRLQVPAGDTEQAHTGRLQLNSVGVVATSFVLVLAWNASHLQISTYVLLALLGGGPLLLTWPTRAARHGRFRTRSPSHTAAVRGPLRGQRGLADRYGARVRWTWCAQKRLH